MTVEELIKELQKYPKNTEVMTTSDITHSLEPVEYFKYHKKDNYLEID